MANDWIKFRVKLATDGRVRAAARATKQKPATILGGLLILWSLADSHADDGGVLGGYTFDDIDDVTGIRGFCAALPPDWIGQTETGILLPRYHDHNGSTAKKRAEGNVRVAVHREKCNADVTRKPLPNADKGVTESVTREEKRREEYRDPPTPPIPKWSDPLPGRLDAPAFHAVWDDWLAHRREIKKKVTAKAAAAQLQSLSEMGLERAVAAVRHSIANGWQGIFEPKNHAPGGRHADREADLRKILETPE